MAAIHPTLVPAAHSDESPASFASRAARLVGRSARDYCLDLGLTFQDIVDGDEEQIGRLAKICSLPGGRFLGVFVTGSGHRYKIGQEVLTRETLSRKILRVCPACIASDLTLGTGLREVRPYGRTTWLLDPIRTCVVHSRPLIVAAEVDDPTRVHDFAALLAPVLDEMMTRADDQDHQDVSSLETYVLDRVGGNERPATWLDRLPLYAACRICEIVGATKLHGIRVQNGWLSDRDWHAAGNAGFGIAAGGESTIREYLSELQERFLKSRATWGPRMIWGRLWEFLAYECSDPAYDEMRALVQRHMMETMPLEPTDHIFGKAVGTRRVHSIRTAAEVSGAHPKRLRKLAKMAGVIEPSSDALTDDRILVPAEKMERFLIDVAESMSLKEAGTYMGVPRPIDLHLLRAGIIEPWIRGGTRLDLQEHAFRKSDLDRFLFWLTRPRGETAGREFYPIGPAARRACCTVVEIIRHILDGSLATVVVLPEGTGYESIRVNVEEILPLVKRPDHNGLSLREAEIRLSTTFRCMKRLIDGGHLPSRRTLNSVNRCPQIVVDEIDLVAFQRRYVSLIVLAREKGIHQLRLKPVLEKAGIRPVFDDVPVSFFERSSLARIF